MTDHGHGFRSPRTRSKDEDRLFQLIARHTETPTQIPFHVQHAEIEKPRVGILVYADGTDWDPGSGEGLYVYKSGGWTFVA